MGTKVGKGDTIYAIEARLNRSLKLLVLEGVVLELSWYGDRRVSG
jgi:hypothetical protein